MAEGDANERTGNVQRPVGRHGKEAQRDEDGQQLGMTSIVLFLLLQTGYPTSQGGQLPSGEPLHKLSADHRREEVAAGGAGSGQQAAEQEAGHQAVEGAAEKVLNGIKRKRF